MRQFRMPIQHTKNLSKFKKQIGTILRELEDFDEQEKYEAFSYLQGCISATSLRKKRNSQRVKLKKRARNFNKRKYKCIECNHIDSSMKGIYAHLQNHDGFPLSCKKCRITFNNSLSFDWHVKFRCRSKNRRKSSLFTCNECPRKFVSKQNLKRHLDGHRRNNCTYCDQVITNRKHLIQHLLDVHSIKLKRAVYECENCDKRYVKKRSLYYHKQQHFPNQYVCLDCGEIYGELEELNRHQTEHDQQKVFNCLKCNQKFSRRQQYLSHIKRHDNYKCITCDETFASKMKMLLHKQKGHSVEGLRPKFSCPDCGKEFLLKSKLLFHLKKHLEDKVTVNCQYCDKTFQSPYAYFNHCITMTHEKCSPETSVFVCESCGKQFNKKYLLEQHNRRVHKNKKEFVTCEFCPYKTKNKTNMNRHKETHINERIFICEQCGKDFNNLASLKGHISYIHTQNKQFKCNQCDKMFKRNSELIRHQEAHSDDRPHVCKICGQSYKRTTHLRRHEKSSHKIIPQRRTNQRLRAEPDGTLVPVPEVQKETEHVATSSIENSEPPMLFTLIETEPLALVKRKNDVDSDRILISLPIQHQKFSYFDNINLSNANFESQNLEEEDIVLDMSMMTSNNDNQYFLNSYYSNDQLIEDYIVQDNLQFSENDSTSSNNIVPSSNRYVLNNIFNFIDSNHCDN